MCAWFTHVYTFSVLARSDCFVAYVYRETLRWPLCEGDILVYFFETNKKKQNATYANRTYTFTVFMWMRYRFYSWWTVSENRTAIKENRFYKQLYTLDKKQEKNNKSFTLKSNTSFFFVWILIKFQDRGHLNFHVCIWHQTHHSPARHETSLKYSAK